MQVSPAEKLLMDIFTSAPRGRGERQQCRYKAPPGPGEQGKERKGFTARGDPRVSQRSSEKSSHIRLGVLWGGPGGKYLPGCSAD